MWLLESAKELILGVDTPEQPVPPHVPYGTTCLLIRGDVGSVSFSVVREGYRDYLRVVRCKRGRGTACYHGILSIVRVSRLPKQSWAFDP
jgi:hypothetical protein